MIRTVEDFLTSLARAGESQIAKASVSHRPTIGDMYEGLTKQLLEKAVFDGLNLNVITGSFIQNQNGQRSFEMDVMLIEGEGEKLPFTDKYVVREGQVIAVFQVKKTLNRKLLEEAYFNLKNVYDTCNLIESPLHGRKILPDAYVSIFRTGVHKSKPIETYFQSTTEEQIWHCIKAEAYLPLRIVFGYQGYRTEAGLRDSFLDFLSDNKMVHGFSPLHFPSLIISGQKSLVKSNGMPYVGPFKNGKWHFFSSSSGKSILHLLELVWSRLSYRFDLDPGIFGEDLEVEGFNKFLSCNLVNVNGQRGWNFDYDEVSKKYFVETTPPVDWAPVSLSIEQHHVIAYLCKYGFLRLTRIRWWLSKIEKEVNLDEFIAGLLGTGLVYVDSYKELRLTTDKCQCVVLPGEGFFAADNKTGRLTRWVERKMAGRTK